MKEKLKVASISVVVNILLVVIKVILATITGSVALLADAYHSASDIGVSLLIMLSLVLPKKASRIVFYVEGAIAIVVSFLIFGAAVGIFIKARGLFQSDIRNIPIALAGVFVCIVVSYFVSDYKVKEGERLSSLSLRADGFHSRMDMFSSIAVMVVLFGQMIGVELDRLAAIVICLLITWVGIEVLINAFKSIAKEGPVEVGALSQIMRSGEWERKLASFPKGPGIIRFISLIARALLSFSSMLKNNIRRLVPVVVVLLILLYVTTGIYIILPDESGALLRFGRLVRSNIPPGPGYRLPWPFEKLIKIRKDVIRRTEVGFRTRPEVSGMTIEREYLWEASHVSGRYIKKSEEALMLTGDENIIDINMVIQYKIRDMDQFLFNITRPDALVRDMAEASVREIIGREHMDGVLTKDRNKVESELVAVLQERLDDRSSGIGVEAIRLQDVHPPVEVVPAFRAVASAKEDKQTLINEALGYKSWELPNAKGEAESRVLSAKAYRYEKVNKARGDASRFLERIEEYKNSEKVTELRMYLETMEKVLTGVNKYIVGPKSISSRHDMWFFGGGKRVYYPDATEGDY